jgi:hypothetical protein
MLPKLIDAEGPTYSYLQKASSARFYSQGQDQIIDLSYDGEFWSSHEDKIYNSRGIGNPMVQTRGSNVDLFV